MVQDVLFAQYIDGYLTFKKGNPAALARLAGLDWSGSILVLIGSMFHCFRDISHFLHLPLFQYESEFLVSFLSVPLEIVFCAINNLLGSVRRLVRCGYHRILPINPKFICGDIRRLFGLCVGLNFGNSSAVAY